MYLLFGAKYVLKSGRDDNGEDNQTGNESHMGVKGADGSLRCDRLTSFAADAACIQDGVSEEKVTAGITAIYVLSTFVGGLVIESFPK